MGKRTIALDYGEARTGVAVSDPLDITAQGVTSIEHKSDKELLEKLQKYIDEYNPKLIVIGMPINMNGTKGDRVRKTKRFIHKLKEAFGLDVLPIDERLTTVSSHHTMTELGVKKEKKKSIVDMMSAVLILQIYLDKKHNKEED
ncbi:MAG: Holliday junction resolvase RuvX [Clostridia bacterium]|nr:Holliday junction resolvase RuvX [Clostridia bacterium]